MRELSPEVRATIMPFLIIIYIVAIILLLITIIGLWKMFQKVGKKGREAIIPIWSIRVLIKISKKPSWFFWIIVVLSILASILGIEIVNNIINLIVLILWIGILIGLSEKFNRHRTFMLGLLFLPFIFYPILGFGKAQYQK